MPPLRHRLGGLLITVLAMAGCAPVERPRNDTAALQPPNQAAFQIQDRHPLPGVLPVQSKPYGKAYGEWASLWWKWAYSVPVAHHPLLDTTGADAGVGQSGPVWFLGGTFGAGTITRTITVPAGKALFFPVLNATWAEDHRVITGDNPPLTPGDPDTPAAALARAQQTLAGATGLSATIDGQSLSDAQVRQYYVESTFSTFPIVAGSIIDGCGGVCWAPDTTEVDNIGVGYYLLVSPPSVGTHTIRFSGRFAGNPDPINVTYQIEVTPGAN